MTTNEPGLRLTAAGSVLLVIDVQEKLSPAIPDRAALVRNLTFLLDAANLLDVPVLATEQYPQGLGPTVAELRDKLPPTRPEKTSFSCYALASISDDLAAFGGRQAVLVGLETHVCVLQTGLDLLAAGMAVFIPVDAVAGRFALDHDIALRRLEKAGAILTTVETAAFEWLGSSTHPHFKAVSQLIRDRAAAVQPGR